METIDRLRRIANRAGAPTMDYAPTVMLQEQRESLDWVAAEAAQAIQELVSRIAETDKLLHQNILDSMATSPDGTVTSVPDGTGHSI